MSPLRRLDAELVHRGLCPSRTRAQDLIRAGSVLVNGVPSDKPARQVRPHDSVVVRADAVQWASRGAHKLLGALAAFEPLGLRPPAGRRVLDAGASTGGFTDVLLSRGAAAVTAVDVGYGQLLWRLRADERVTVLDRTNVRHLEPVAMPHRPDLIVADLSFIPLGVVLPALVGLIEDDGDMLLMVKPQFEVGREALGTGGVVRDPAPRAAAVQGVLAAADRLGWGCRAVAASALPGPNGNVEFFVWLRRGSGSITDDDVVAATEGSPQ